jgi:hypothetical protein
MSAIPHFFFFGNRFNIIKELLTRAATGLLVTRGKEREVRKEK